MCTRQSHRRITGISLIELVIFIVVVSIGIVGILLIFNVSVKASADPMRRKQAIAIAESLLTEIEQQPLTYCDPQDANVLSAIGTAGCTTSQDGSGGVAGSTLSGPMPAGETRTPNFTFNNVADYGAFHQVDITDVAGTNAMTGYTADVNITRAGNAAPFASITDPGAVLKIVVTVTFGTESVSLIGYRFRYAPNAAG